MRESSCLQLVSKQTQLKEWLLAALFFVCAFVAVLAVALIFAFVGWKAAPILTEVGLREFLLGAGVGPDRRPVRHPRADPRLVHRHSRCARDWDAARRRYGRVPL